MTPPVTAVPAHRTVVFAGPTIGAAEIRHHLPDADVRPPAARGDVYRVAHGGAGAIAIIDGLFESVPSIWHKEILDALDRGVRVYRAASMGAIRAAECDGFGMVGIGSVYEGFRAGAYDDDDVAVAHGSAEDGFQPVSEAMVNVRATLPAAVAAGVLSEDVGRSLDGLAKGVFYPHRTWRHLDELGRTAGLAPADLRALQDWRETSAIDLKRTDALALLDRLATVGAHHEPSEVPGFAFNRTSCWQQMRTEEDALPSESTAGMWQHPVIEELQVHPAELQPVAAEAVRRRYARELARAAGAVVSQPALDEASDRLRRRLGLLESNDLEAWLAQTGLTFEAYTEMAHREAMVHLGESLLPPFGQEDVLDVALLTGRLDELEGRARAKAERLRSRGAEESGHLPDGLTDDEVLEWFSRERLGRAAPVGEELERTATQLGFEGVDQLLGAARRERRAGQEAV